MKRSSSSASYKSSRRPPLILFPAIAVVLVLVLSGAVIHLLTESWWFAAVDYADVFWRRIRWQGLIWLATLVLAAGFLLANYGLAAALTRDSPWRLGKNAPPIPRLAVLPSYGAIALSLVVAFGIALQGAAAWDSILQFLNLTPFDQRDPLFQQDLSFYFFQLPIYQGLQLGLLQLVLWALAIAIAVYALKGEIRPERGWKYFLTGAAKTHLCLLLAGLAVLIAVGFYLERYELLFSPSGIIFGAGFTDVNARLQAYWMMAFVTLAVAALFIVSLGRSGFLLPSVGIVLYVAVLVLVSGFYPWFQQRFQVAPNELVREQPYIEHNIAYTRDAYGLATVESNDFPAEASLTQADLTANSPTVDNIRLWDYRPILSTYRQLQEIRLYYRFQDVDVDRYTLDGNYRQVMVAAREMDYSQAAPEAQTWVNQRLKFTHGYGIVMSPVNQATTDGLPELMIRNIPPVIDIDLALEEPRIYYGEATRNYIFTGTDTDEFDYPLGNDNAVNRYEGSGGVPIGSLGRRLAYAFELGDFNALISNYFIPDSRVHYHRQIVERARQVAPFLTYDSDPYIAVVEGRLKWVLDAYTTSDRYPYSQPLIRSSDVNDILGNPVLAQIARRGTNYIRDAAKVVIDAYDGSLTFYALDGTDPILSTYRKIFPNLFQDMTTVPSALQEHFRYPQDLFTLQAHMYRTYHMANPEVFYNREDVWRFPMQIYEGASVMMEPYHTIMRLPDTSPEEFIQIMPFTPVNRDNMVAWLAGRSDGDSYGTLLEYQFPKERLIYGPSQIEARINQTPEISQQLTLWSQEGSRVIRGDMLVIPIERSLLYVEPVYLRAEQGELPELRRVIVAYSDRIVMAETLDAALVEIFGAADPDAAPEAEATLDPDQVAVPQAPATPEVAAQIQAALDAYTAGQTALQAGDWDGYGQAQRDLERILTQLNDEI
ncbi:UPF0182 family protein [Leptolyngbya sp. PCC 6406]|uniref:UPF0182 family membrane protein n=1 Tax=Leptolyngbya sp. PCC 6406 TaxID=1173264 RepID=UPI0002ACEEA8|nr:UPF0182 family protein [Leptolyngbya sp. PCC 6406]